MMNPPAEPGGFEVSLDGMVRISFNRDPEETSEKPAVHAATFLVALRFFVTVGGSGLCLRSARTIC